jgi:hypothetical protein
MSGKGDVAYVYVLMKILRRKRTVMSRVARVEVSDNGAMRIAAEGRQYGANDRRVALSRNMGT